MRYDKLVRDKIIERMSAKGVPSASHVADEEEYWQKLKAKLAEEVGEFRRDENIEELADILEVIDAIIEHKGFDRAELQRIKAEKAEERGGFKKRIILEEA